MRRDGAEETLVGGVADAELFAGLFDQLAQRWIVNVADAMKQVMLDLEIQSAQEPAQHGIAAGEIDSGLNLVHGPVGFHFPVGAGKRKIGLFDTVRQLKDDAEDNATAERGEEIDA